MISELEALQRIERPTPNDLQRISQLRRKNRVIRPKVVHKAAPPISGQLDLVREKFGKKIEPWSIFECSECNVKYHLIDGAKCDCGKQEAKNRYIKYLGGLQIGSAKQ